MTEPFYRYKLTNNSLAGIVNLFQTLADLEYFNDKEVNVQAIRRVLNER